MGEVRGHFALYENELEKVEGVGWGGGANGLGKLEEKGVKETDIILLH